MLALAIGLFIFGRTLTERYVSRSFEIASKASVPAVRSADSVRLAKQVMDIYRSLTPEEREAPDYLDRFSEINTEMMTNEPYDVLFHMLRSYITDVDDVYLGMFDRESSALVYIADPDENEETRLRLGEWEPVSEEECSKFLDWNGEGMLYDISDTEKYGWMCTAGYPIRDESGEICEFVLVDTTLGSVIRELGIYALRVGLTLAAATALMAWLIERRMRRMVVDPINEIANAANAYVQDKHEGVERQHFANLGIQTGDEIENLTGVMADMEQKLARHEAHIRSITAEEERLRTELSMASQIQASMLPGSFSFPNHREFDVFGSMTPAREVGGDFYDFYLIDDDHLCMVIADVSGKGVPAALFMMIAKTIIQSCAMLGQNPAEILASTNEAFCTNNKLQMFVTAWVGVLEISTGRVTAANAGHEYPVLMQDGKFRQYRDPHSFVLGGLDCITYHNYEIMLAPGDRIFIHTDGVTEATNAGNEMFGKERMLEALNTDPGASPEQVLKNVQSAVEAFVRDAEQFDDLTMLCLAYSGNAPEPTEA